MNWNGDRANDYFIGEHSRINPDSLIGKPLPGLFDVELAIKNVYFLCACEAWTKERLVNALQNAISGDIHIDRKANDPEKYKNAFKGHAQDILDDIENGKISFS